MGFHSCICGCYFQDQIISLLSGADKGEQNGILAKGNRRGLVYTVCAPWLIWLERLLLFSLLAGTTPIRACDALPELSQTNTKTRLLNNEPAQLHATRNLSVCTFAQRYVHAVAKKIPLKLLLGFLSLMNMINGFGWMEQGLESSTASVSMYVLFLIKSDTSRTVILFLLKYWSYWPQTPANTGGFPIFFLFFKCILDIKIFNVRNKHGTDAYHINNKTDTRAGTKSVPTVSIKK